MRSGCSTHGPRHWSCIALALTTALATAPGRAFCASEEAVNNAIDAGVGFLLAESQKSRVDKWKEGQVALETYALIVAGVNVQHPVIRGNFEFLHKSVPRGKTERPTYTLSCYIFALDAAISQIESDLLILAPKRMREMFRDDPRIGREYRGYLATAVETLVGLQTKGGGWDYGAPGARFDNSNTQFAVLALGVGAKRSVPIDTSVWLKILDHFVKGQQQSGPETGDRITLMTPSEKEEWNEQVRVIARSGGEAEKKEKKEKQESGRTSAGRTGTVETPPNPEVGYEGLQVFQRGWDYENKGGASWNMTNAGLSSLILVRERVGDRLDRAQRESLHKAIRDGFGWLMGSWGGLTHSYYGMYSLEKVADLGDVKLFAGHDWYEELANHIVGAQQVDGSWKGGGAHGENEGGGRIATSFALLILNRASSLITKTPQSRIVLSGQRSSPDPNDRSWVYVPELDTTVHYPTLMRHIRMRPTRKLIEFLRSIVESYPPEWRGELIPEMAKIRDALDSPAAKTVIEKYLTLITGHAYKEWEDYLKWHRRWERVMRIGAEKRLDKVPELLRYYKSTNKSNVLKLAVMWALVQCNARAALPLFLEDLDNSDADIRRSAYNSFRAFFTTFPPQFDPRGAEDARREQVVAIRTWYEKEEERRAGG